MKVVYVDKIFGDLRRGDVFSSDGNLYIKTDDYIAPDTGVAVNCINLENGEGYCFFTGESVHIHNAEIYARG
jgi:hypothetical protein